MRVESLASSSTCAKNVSEVANRCVFSMNRGSWCSKSRLAKAAGAEVAVRGQVKMARGCGEKHICKSKCTKHHMGGAILEVAMFKNGTRLWRKAHLQVKMHKAPHWRSHFGSCDVQKLHAAVARSIFVSQNVENTTLSGTFGSSDVQKWHAAVGRSTFARQNVLNTCVLQHFARFLTE